MNVTANFADVRVFWVSSVTEPAAVEALLMENISRIRKDMYEVSGELNVFILHYSALKCSLFRVGKVTQNSVRPGYQLSSHAEDGSVVPDVGAAARYPGPSNAFVLHWRLDNTLFRLHETQGSRGLCLELGC